MLQGEAAKARIQARREAAELEGCTFSPMLTAKAKAVQCVCTLPSLRRLPCSASLALTHTGAREKLTTACTTRPGW